MFDSGELIGHEILLPNLGRPEHTNAQDKNDFRVISRIGFAA